MAYIVSATTGQFVTSLRDPSRWILSDEELGLITKVELILTEKLQELQKIAESKNQVCSEKRSELIKASSEAIEQSSSDSQKTSSIADNAKLKYQQLKQELPQLEKDLEATNKELEKLRADVTEQNTLLQTVRLHSNQLNDLVENVIIAQQKINELNDKLEPLRNKKKELEETHTRNSTIAGYTMTGIATAGGVGTIITHAVIGVSATLLSISGVGCTVLFGAGIYVSKQIYSSRTALEKVKPTNISPDIVPLKSADKSGTEINKWMSNLYTNLRIETDDQNAIKLFQKIREIWTSATNKADEYLNICAVAHETHKKLREESDALNEALTQASELNTAERVAREQDKELISPLLNKKTV